MTEQQRTQIANWIPDATSTIDEEHERNTYATSSTHDVFTDDTVTSYHDALDFDTNAGESGRQHPSTPDGVDREIEVRLIQYWKNRARNTLDASENASAENYLRKILERSETIHGARFEGRGEILQMLALALSRQGKWEETYKLMREKFDGWEETMEKLATHCLLLGRWEQAEKILIELWKHPAEPQNYSSRAQRRMRLLYAFAKVYFGKRDYTNAKKWCQQAISEVKANVGMQGRLFYESIYLFSEIHKAYGDIEEAEAYSSLLPEDFFGTTSLERQH